ncbi:hypothetical protein [Marilutibacter alkalisoli]|uniref:DUF3558 domain-containing protein n=1 Tax=Marilutibacter alkalisoli TaxID=2591633 RepID=A0A514BUL5_9GAMM|nr:hypothetical protein [Lysobacter alkalisoli]QDH71094.1 hypothetical protein FKV23_14105 [Lysobacter alkalisoli]
MRIPIPAIARSALILATVLIAAIAGCDRPQADSTTQGSDGLSSYSAPESWGNETCKLLRDSEIEAVIDEHTPGRQDLLFGGCIWPSKTTLSDGRPEAIHAAVLSEGEYRQLAEIGEPIDGFGEGATWAELYGELWFRCAGGRYCGIKVVTASSEYRREHAEGLARALGSRVR